MLSPNQQIGKRDTPFEQYKDIEGAEGTEEVLSGVAQAFGKKLTYMSEEDLGKIIKDERLFDQFLTGAITSGIAQSGIVPGMKAGSFIEATKAGRDLIAVDDVGADSAAQKNATQEGDAKYSLAAFEKDGRRFVEIDQNQERFDGHSPDEYPGIAKEIIKEKFENRVIGIDNKMFVNGAGRSEFAYPSKPITDADIYEAKMRSSAELDNLLDAGANYRNEADGKDGHVHPDAVGGFDYYDTLFKIGNRYFEGRINIKNVKRGKLFTDVTQIKDVTQAIMSSYGQNPKSQFLRTSSIDSISNANENVNSQVSTDADYQERYKPYQVDLSRYKPQEQAIYKRHMDSGMVNNRKATHEFVDLLVKLETEKGVHFDLSTSKRLAQSGFAVEGATVSGVKTADGILVNINANSALNSVVGHEIMHVFEGTEYYDVIKQAVKEFAEAKGIYQSRYDSIAKLYEKVQGADIEGELTADLIGEYLFTDKDFVRNLSTKHRNLFQRIYDEIKYLCKLATADSAEARKLEKVKKTFAELYREADIKNTARTDGVKYSLLVKDVKGNTTAVNPAETTPEQIRDYMVKSRKGQLEQYTYFPVSSHTSKTVISTLRNAGIDIADKPLAMQAKKARQSQNDGQHIERDGTVVRHHALTPDEIVEAIEKLDNPIAAIHQQDRVKKEVEYGKTIYVPAPDNFVFFVTLDNGKECAVVIEFDSFIKKESIQKDGLGDDYHTTVTVFEPDQFRDGEEFDYIEYLAVQPSNRELEIKKESPETETAISQTQATVSEKELSNNSIRNPDEKVNGKFSLSETKDTAPAGGYRITGEDIALAPTREDIARMEQEKERIATAQTAPRNDAEELSAPTREDIARMDRDKKLKGPLLMKDSLDRELEKLYRLQQLNQIQDNAYFVELFKVNAAYQAAGRDFTEAFNRVVDAYQGEVETQETVENKNSYINLEDYANSESPVWRNVAFNDDATKASIMQSAHAAMVAEGSVVSVTQDVIDTVEQSFPDLRSMKKKERTPILKDAINKLKNNIRQFLTGLSNQNFEFEVNGKVLDAKLYSTGINEVLEKVTQEKANMLYSTEEIFRNARYLYSTPDYDGDPNVYRWNYFYTPVRIGDEIVGVRIAVRDMVKGTDGATPESQIYNWGIKKNASLDDGSHDPRAASSGVSSDASINNIPEDASGVKYSLDQSATEDLGAPTREDIARMEAEKELHGPWRCTMRSKVCRRVSGCQTVLFAYLQQDEIMFEILLVHGQDSWYNTKKTFCRWSIL